MEKIYAEKVGGFREQLIALGACAEAIAWVGERDRVTAWNECLREDWLIWLMQNTRMKVMKKQWVQIAIGEAESVLHFAHEQDRGVCQKAIDSARAVVKRDTAQARAAAGAAVDAAGAARDAAGAARDAAGAARDAAGAARDAAWAAADAAWAAGAARDAARAASVDRIRAIVKAPKVIR